MSRRPSTWRRIKFAAIERVLGPAALLLLRALVATYRVAPANRTVMAGFADHPRVVVATGHGMFLSVLAYARHLPRNGRRPAVMTSPSRDGRLIDMAITAFGMRAVKGSSRSRAVPATMELMEAVREGDYGVLAVDGPRGPLLVPKAGVVAIARRLDAQIFVLSVTGSPRIVFRSWDRMFLPIPFARVSARCREFHLLPGEDDDAALARLGAMLRADALEMNSPPGIAAAQVSKDPA